MSRFFNGDWKILQTLFLYQSGRLLTAITLSVHYLARVNDNHSIVYVLNKFSHRYSSHKIGHPRIILISVRNSAWSIIYSDLLWYFCLCFLIATSIKKYQNVNQNSPTRKILSNAPKMKIIGSLSIILQYIEEAAKLVQKPRLQFLNRTARKIEKFQSNTTSEIFNRFQ